MDDNKIIELFNEKVRFIQRTDLVFTKRRMVKYSVLNIYFDSLYGTVCDELNIAKSDENYDYINDLIPIY